MGLADFPELLYDTISVNKIYRRDLLVAQRNPLPRGPALRGPAVHPRGDGRGPQGRGDPRGRLPLVRRPAQRRAVDHAAAQRGAQRREPHRGQPADRRLPGRPRPGPDCRRSRTSSSSSTTSTCTSSSMLEVDDETARTLMDRLVPYVADGQPRPAWQLRPALRVAIYHLLRRRPRRRARGDAIRAVGLGRRRADRRRGRTRDVGVRAPRWRSGRSAGFDAREWLDVTDLHLLTIPFTQRRYLHRLDALVASRARDVVATGSTVDYDGSLPAVDSLELRLLVGGPTHGDVGAGDVDGSRWTALAVARPEDRLADRLGRPARDEDRGTVALALRRACTSTSRACGRRRRPRPGAVRFPGRRRWTGPDAVELSAHENGAVGWRGSEHRAVADATGRRAVPLVPDPGPCGWRSSSTSFAATGCRPLVQRRGVGCCPRRSLAVLESDGGRTSSGNVRAISELLRREPAGPGAGVGLSDPAGAHPGVRRAGRADEPSACVAAVARPLPDR